MLTKSRFEGITNGLASLFRGGILLNENNREDIRTCTSGFKLAEKLNFNNFHPV